MPTLSLCRFRIAAGEPPRMGLVADDRLYDLSSLGEPQYAGIGAWLVSASGRIDEAIDALAAIPDCVQPIASLEALLDPQQAPFVAAPIDEQEVWACGVTYEMSREARMRESNQPTIYGRVYDAPRPEVFFKATPHRVVGPGEAVAIRADSTWDVPEPEMALLVTPVLEIVGYTVGNDMSSRDIEGQNPLYLPQAKTYDLCCSLGPLVRLARDFDPLKLAVRCIIRRDGEVAFSGETSTARIHRPLEELVSYLGRCNSFPHGVFVLTGTGIVPPDTFTLAEGDVVEITIDELGTLTNPVISLPID
ncbi:MAG TPA: fumarylacetoacetate hydrolase [Chloroflexi bacterium]|nr:fumarylacetoacetate hydrolase [Chloroflexota bacterium]